MARSGRAVDVFFRILGAYFGHSELLKEGGKVAKKGGRGRSGRHHLQ